MIATDVNTSLDDIDVKAFGIDKADSYISFNVKNVEEVCNRISYELSNYGVDEGESLFEDDGKMFTPIEIIKVLVQYVQGEIAYERSNLLGLDKLNNLIS